jgi:hypothetical protein
VACFVTDPRLEFRGNVSGTPPPVLVLARLSERAPRVGDAADGVPMVPAESEVMMPGGAITLTLDPAL